MSINTILNTSSSGLLASQTALRTISDNIANVNTPGYVRKAAIQEQRVADGSGSGVTVTGVKRITDQYLQLASLTATSEASKWDVVSQYMDNAQSLFGDPSGDSFFFGRLDSIYSAFASAADDPSSSLLRTQALSNVDDFLKEADRVNVQIAQLGKTMDTRITADVQRANDLLSQIEDLNSDIQRAKVLGADSSGSENIQSGLLDELSSLMNVRIQARQAGGVTVRSQEGVQLAGDGAAILAYNKTDSTRGYITATSLDSGVVKPIGLNGGEIRGLMELRDERLPELSDQLGEFMAKATERLNAAHNASAAIPAPTTLSGRNTGLDLPTAVTGFSGTATVAIVNGSGVIQQRVDIDFTAGTMSVNGGGGPAFTPANFLTQLNTALGGAGTASFTNGALSITAGGANGVAMSEGTSAKTGKGFSHFFGLNDLVRSSGFTSYETGLTGASPHGFTPGDPVTLRIANAEGKPLKEVTVAVPAGGTMNNLLTALNDNVSGVGLYGQFSLSANGVMTFAPTGGQQVNLSVVSDNTQRGAGGPSISELFGIGVTERTARAGRFQVAPALAADPSKMALAQLDLTVGAGQPAVRPGDGRGALALAQSGDVPTLFQAAGSLGVVSMTAAQYAAEFGGSIGRAAASADVAKSGAEAVQSEATARRQAVEGVNLDEELIQLTTYQQAFNASARMIQAAKELYDVLLGII